MPAARSVHVPNVFALIALAAASAHAADGDTSDAPWAYTVVSPARPGRFTASGFLVGDASPKQFGGQAELAFRIHPNVSVGAGAVVAVDANPGALLTVNFQPVFQFGVRWRPVIGLRGLFLHPGSMPIWGLGFWAGATAEAGPGRVMLGLGGDRYHDHGPYPSGDTLVMLGYELDLTRTPEQVREVRESVVRTPSPTPTANAADGLLDLVVTDAETGQPIDGEVSSGGATPSTWQTSGGHLAGARLPAGPVLLAVTAPGYDTGEVAASMAPGSSTHVTVALVRAGGEHRCFVEGHVRGSDGQPLEANFEIRRIHFHLRSGADGTFRGSMPAGTYVARISAPGYLPQSKAVHLNPGETVIFNLDLSPASP